VNTPTQEAITATQERSVLVPQPSTVANHPSKCQRWELAGGLGSPDSQHSQQQALVWWPHQQQPVEVMFTS
jgi:hypothetical protein